MSQILSDTMRFYKKAWTSRQAFLKALLPWSVVYFLATLLAARNGEGLHLTSFAILAFVIAVTLLAMYAAQNVVSVPDAQIHWLPKGPLKSYFFVNLFLTVGAFALAFVCGLIAMVVYFAAYPPTMIPGEPFQLSHTAERVFALIHIVFMLVILVRFVPVGAVLIRRGEKPVRQTLKLTKGYYWRIMLLQCVIMLLPAGAVFLSGTFNGSQRPLLESGLWTLLETFGEFVLIAVYAEFVEAEYQNLSKAV